MRVSLGSGVDKRGALLIYSLSSVKALSHSGVALEGLKEGCTVIGSLRDEPSQGRDTSGKALDILDYFRHLHVQDDLNFFGVGLNTSLIDHETKELS